MQIIAHEYGDFYIADQRFTTLHELVEYYYNTFLCDDMVLSNPVRPAAPVEVSAYTCTLLDVPTSPHAPRLPVAVVWRPSMTTTAQGPTS